MKTITTLVSALCLTSSAWSDEFTGNWYAGFGLHALVNDKEHDGSLETVFKMSGPRIYGGYRFSRLFSLEAETGKAKYDGLVWNRNLEAELDLKNFALTGIFHIPVSDQWFVEPFVYLGAGKSKWKYRVGGRLVTRVFAHSGSDGYRHHGFGIEMDLSHDVKGRINYRDWRSDITPPEDGWAADPSDYYYRRKGLDVSFHMTF